MEEQFNDYKKEVDERFKKLEKRTSSVEGMIRDILDVIEYVLKFIHKRVADKIKQFYG
jgi:predicted glycosyltransferase|tara:strand:- start:1413 stop:1586 length:174 start_codon:yes stop_codon:yes gene_type:complete